MTWKSCPYSVRELECIGLWNVRTHAHLRAEVCASVVNVLGFTMSVTDGYGCCGLYVKKSCDIMEGVRISAPVWLPKASSPFFTSTIRQQEQWAVMMRTNLGCCHCA